MSISKSISFIIPTLNASDVIKDCIESIVLQDYPLDKMEILIIDGYSSDNTVKIVEEVCEKYNINFRIYYNRDKTCEAGKQIGIRKAQNEIIALIDSDNILESKSWLKRMMEPFEEKDIVGTEPLYFTYRRNDPLITRYCALLGANDPTCYYLGNYDRYSKLSNKWTGLDIPTKDEGSYIVIELDEKNIPTIGANGFLFRKKAYQINMDDRYFFDIDEVYNMVMNGHNKFAKVKIGIIHVYAGNLGEFIKKQKRRILDYRYYKEKDLRVYPWGNNKLKLAKFIVFSIIPIIPLVDSIRGYVKFKDRAWFFHPVACFFTLAVYIIYFVKSKFRIEVCDRSKW